MALFMRSTSCKLKLRVIDRTTLQELVQKLLATNCFSYLAVICCTYAVHDQEPFLDGTSRHMRRVLEAFFTDAKTILNLYDQDEDINDHLFVLRLLQAVWLRARRDHTPLHTEDV